MPQREHRHLSVVPDLEPPDVQPSDLIRTVMIEPKGLTEKQRQVRKERMRQLGVAVSRFRQPGERA